MLSKEPARKQRDMLVRGLVRQEGHAVLGAIVFEDDDLIADIDTKGSSIGIFTGTGFRMNRGTTVSTRFATEIEVIGQILVCLSASGAARVHDLPEHVGAGVLPLVGVAEELCDLDRVELVSVHA